MTASQRLIYDCIRSVAVRRLDLSQFYITHGNPNGVVDVPNTQPAICCDPQAEVVYVKTDGVPGNTGWLVNDLSPSSGPVNDPVFNSVTHVWHLQEASGNARVDSVGAANLNETGGTVASATGIHNNAADLTGVLGHYLNTSATSVVNAGAWSIAFWVNLNQRTSAQDTVLVRQNDGGNNGEFTIGTIGSSVGLSNPQIYVSTVSEGQLLAPVTISASSWHLIVVTLSFPGLSGFLYIDGGVPNTFEPADGSSSSGTFQVDDSGLLALGLIDEVMIWPIELTAGNVTTLWNGGAGTFYSP